MTKHRAFLKWAGGKYLLIDSIRRHLPEGDCLVEPFVGAGSVFLNLDYPAYELADVNADLINLYNIIKYRSTDFISDARFFFTAKGNHSDTYYARRQQFNQSDDPYLRALLFLYLNRHGYNGLCRYNLRGQFNVPFGRYKKPYFPEAELLWFAERAQKANFHCRSYDETMQQAASGTVIYCDPPYAPLAVSGNFTSYHTNGFSLEQQQHLARIAAELAQKKAIPVLISNHDTAMTRLWYQQAVIHVVQTRRSISRSNNGRVKINELLAVFACG